MNEKLILEALQFITFRQVSSYQDDTIAHKEGMDLVRRIELVLNPKQEQSLPSKTKDALRGKRE